MGRSAQSSTKVSEGLFGRVLPCPVAISNGRAGGRQKRDWEVMGHRHVHPNHRALVSPAVASQDKNKQNSVLASKGQHRNL